MEAILMNSVLYGALLSARKDYWFHFRGFLIGTALSLAASFVIGGLAFAAFRLFG